MCFEFTTPHKNVQLKTCDANVIKRRNHFKGAGGEISFETVIQSRTVLPERVIVIICDDESLFVVFVTESVESSEYSPECCLEESRVKVLRVFPCYDLCVPVSSLSVSGVSCCRRSM